MKTTLSMCFMLLLSIYLVAQQPNFQIIQTFQTGGRMEVADVDGDNDLDLILANSTISWFENDSGMFNPAITIAEATTSFNALEVADMNGDERPDIIVYEEYGPSTTDMSIFPNTGSGTYFGDSVRISDSVRATRIEAVDLNNDGLPELVFYANVDIQVIHNDGGLQFSDKQIIYGEDFPHRTHGMDIDQDGYMDLVVARLDGSFFALINDQNGGFETPTLFAMMNGIPISMTSGDIDGDNLPDVVLSTDAGLIRWFQNNGTGGFNSGAAIQITSPGTYPGSSALRDLDNDGDLDLLFCFGSSASRIGWYENVDGTFGQLDTIFSKPTSYPKELVTGDFDLDGDVDFVTYLVGNIKLHHFRNDLINSVIDPVEHEVAIYPNPTKAMLFIKGTNPVNGIEIYSASCQLMRKFQPDPSGTIDVSNLEPGMYLIRGSDDDQAFTQRFVKQ